ncbi:thioredoxin-dependent thiol peroxidase [Salmonirosea aquatica]|uniref:thioredoxin-dependent peroxiredoxin n=1 Tax=Salmonirosea aquatica TaxID=2654236 RepID=A0A7C9BMR9_9BACT|nr:thioredoxin-dependent thiol peroxidase [Cytophagaceae bacterium SJW1-29]
MTLQVGDSAPDFTAKDQDGQSISLHDFKGKKLVLYFYPKDDTPGCTAQACDLRDNYERMLAQGYAVVGVSVDDEKSHQKFIKKFDLPFPLIADTDHAVVESYGVWGEKKNYGRTYLGTIRTTFVIDEQGKIEDIISKVNTKEHTSQILS